MPWMECSVMDAKLKFVARLLDGEDMTGLCRDFGISRKTGYKIWDRYKECGLMGISDRDRRPMKQANRLPFQIEKLIIQLKKEKPHWGAPKIRELLLRRHSHLQIPAKSTVHAVLARNNLVTVRRRSKKGKSEGTVLSYTSEPNALWCADYKGQFLMGNQIYCYPLTITDYASRYLNTCHALETTKQDNALSEFEAAFKE